MKDKMNKIEDLLQDPSFVKWVKAPNPELEAYWTQWGAKHPERAKDIALAKEFLIRIEFKKTLPNEEQIHLSYGKTIDAINNGKGKAKSYYIEEKRRPFLSYNYFGGIAAIILALIVSTFIIYKFNVDEPEALVETPTVSIITKSNPAVVKSQIRLPDGSRVWLNSESSISYPETFGQVREIQLTGEAYFEVVENLHHPFVVKTEFTEVKVLGTSFNVNAYKDNTSEMVSLVNGKVEVKLNSDGQATTLVPGQQIVYDINKKHGEVSRFDVTEVVGWKDGWLVLRNANFNQIIGKLERWYGVKIEILNKPAEDWNVNGHFQDQPLEVVLDRLSFSKDFEYTMDGKNIKIKFI